MKEYLEIYKEDEVSLKVNLSASQAMELKEFSSFYAEGYKFHPAFRARIWNGKVSWANIKDKIIPIGLLPELFKFCERYKYTPKFLFDASEFVPDQLTDEDLEKFYSVLFEGTKFFPRDYQHDAIKAALNNKRGIVLSPTGCLDPSSKVKCKISKHDYEYLVKNFPDDYINNINQLHREKADSEIR